MAENEGLRVTGEAVVKNTTPDVCKTPPSMAPVPYEIIGRFSDAVRYADTVCMTTLNVITVDSRLTTVYGDEAGTGGGIISTVNRGWCRPVTHSTTVRAKGHFITYHTSTYEMNCNGPEGPGNTRGNVIYVESISCVYIGPLGAIEGNTSPPPKPETKEEESWWEKGLSWVHTGLDVVGMIPGLGEIADGANAIIHGAEAAIYAATGNEAKALENSAMAALSVAAMWPAGGQAATVAKWGIKGGKELVQAGTKQALKEGIEEGTEKVLKEGTEELSEQAAKETVETGVEVTTKSKKIPCFPAGTLVHTAIGLRPIETIRIADLVFAFDMRAGRVVERPVLRIFTNKTSILAQISFRDEIVRSTSNHRFWVPELKEWVEACRLSRGMAVGGRYDGPLAIERVELVNVEACDTFNISVHGDANYFVGTCGSLVHNDGDTPSGKVYIGYDSNGKPVYVGQTKQELDARQKQHWKDAQKQPDKYGFKKDMTIKEVPGMNGLTDAEMDYHERRIYDELKADGHDLKNRQIPLGDEKYNKLIKENC